MDPRLSCFLQGMLKILILLMYTVIIIKIILSLIREKFSEDFVTLLPTSGYDIFWLLLICGQQV